MLRRLTRTGHVTLPVPDTDPDILLFDTYNVFYHVQQGHPRPDGLAHGELTLMPETPIEETVRFTANYGERGPPILEVPSLKHSTDQSLRVAVISALAHAYGVGPVLPGDPH